MDPILLESILATTGIPPTRAITLGTIETATGIRKRWNARIVDFVAGKQGKFSWEVAPSSDDLRAKLSAQPTPDDAVKWAGKVGDDPMAVAFIAGKVQQVLDYLLSIWPVITIDVPGAPIVPLSRDDLDSVWSVCRVLWKAETLIEELEAWTVTDAQSKAFRVIFPELSASIDTMIAMAYVERIGGGEHISPEVEDVVKTWKGMSLDTPIKFEAPKGEKEPSNTPSQELVDAAKSKAPSEFQIGERIGK